MDIRRQRCADAFAALGMPDTGRLLGDDYAQVGDFMRLESGQISPEEFREIVKSMIPRQVSDAQIDHALNQFLIGIPCHRLASLRELRKRFRVYLLSNTNPIMWYSKIADEFRQERLTIDDYFDGIVTSFEAHVAKPDAAIFIYAAEKFGIKTAQDTVIVTKSGSNLLDGAHLHTLSATIFCERTFAKDCQITNKAGAYKHSKHSHACKAEPICVRPRHCAPAFPNPYQIEYHAMEELHTID